MWWWNVILFLCGNGKLLLCIFVTVNCFDKLLNLLTPSFKLTHPIYLDDLHLAYICPLYTSKISLTRPSRKFIITNSCIEINIMIMLLVVIFFDCRRIAEDIQYKLIIDWHNKVFAIFGFRRFGVDLAPILTSIFDLRLFHTTDLASIWCRFPKKIDAKSTPNRYQIDVNKKNEIRKHPN